MDPRVTTTPDPEMTAPASLEQQTHPGGGDTEYVVYRQGAGNASDGVPVLRIRANGPEEACRLAAAQVPVSSGERLFAEPAAALDAREHNLNLKVEALERQQS